MTVGAPPGLTVAMLLPATSPRTSAKVRARSRHRRAGAASKPEGPGVSSSALRNATASEASTVRASYGSTGVAGRGDACVARRKWQRWRGAEPDAAPAFTSPRQFRSLPPMTFLYLVLGLV